MLIGLTASFNLASALIQIFWVVMSVVGLTLRIRSPAPPSV
jgi:phage shock protein PspC (stress-responsive transcriptional regulator)